MLTLRIDYNDADGVHYVVMSNGEDVYTTPNRDVALKYVSADGVLPDEALSECNGLVSRAKSFAIKMHGDQMHGCLPMRDHLEAVSYIVFGYSGECSDIELAELEAAAWLHDIMEDTPVTFDTLEDQFGLNVACIVDAVTDRPGINRYERHLNTYYRIREYGSDAVLIKLADRVHNHARSIKHRETYIDMYLGEYHYFKMALWRPREHVKLWELLDNQYMIMGIIRNGEGLQEGGGLVKDPRASETKPRTEAGSLLG